MKNFFSLILALLVIGSLSEAKASQSFRFEDISREVGNFVTKFKKIELSLHELNSSVVKNLEQKAEEQSLIWYDTILEGDYVLTQEGLKLNEVSALYDSEGNFVAYRVVYSKRAWDTSSCEFSWDDLDDSKPEQVKEALKNCNIGHIIGTSFVSPDLKNVERDYNNIEYFQED